MDIREKFGQVNRRLKASQVGVTVEQLGSRLLLKATLSPKPDSRKNKPW